MKSSTLALQDTPLCIGACTLQVLLHYRLHAPHPGLSNSWCVSLLRVWTGCRYALDLNGELSAFDGYLLDEQTQFALACLKQIRAMYSSTAQQQQQQRTGASQLPFNLLPQPPFQPGSSTDIRQAAAIVLVGHSMGGVVARAAASAAWRDPELGGCRA